MEEFEPASIILTSKVSSDWRTLLVVGTFLIPFSTALYYGEQSDFLNVWIRQNPTSMLLFIVIFFGIGAVSIFQLAIGRLEIVVDEIGIRWRWLRPYRFGKVEDGSAEWSDLKHYYFRYVKKAEIVRLTLHDGRFLHFNISSTSKEKQFDPVKKMILEYVETYNECAKRDGIKLISEGHTIFETKSAYISAYIVAFLALAYLILASFLFQHIPAILHIGVFVATYWFLGSVIGGRKKMKEEALAAKEKHSDSDQQNYSEQPEST